jgi:hypothetical protein
VVLVTLGGCHLLDNLVACGLYCESHMKLCVAPEQDFVRGVVLALWEIAKSNSSRARCEEHQVVGRIKVLELLCKHSLWWRELVCSPLARGSATTLDLPQRGLSSWQTTEP